MDEIPDTNVTPEEIAASLRTDHELLHALLGKAAEGPITSLMVDQLDLSRIGKKAGASHRRGLNRDKRRLMDMLTKQSLGHASQLAEDRIQLAHRLPPSQRKAFLGGDLPSPMSCVFADGSTASIGQTCWFCPDVASGVLEGTVQISGPVGEQACYCVNPSASQLTASSYPTADQAIAACGIGGPPPPPPLPPPPPPPPGSCVHLPAVMPPAPEMACWWACCKRLPDGSTGIWATWDLSGPTGGCATYNPYACLGYDYILLGPIKGLTEFDAAVAAKYPGCTCTPGGPPPPPPVGCWYVLCNTIGTPIPFCAAGTIKGGVCHPPADPNNRPVGGPFASEADCEAFIAANPAICSGPPSPPPPSPPPLGCPPPCTPAVTCPEPVVNVAAPTVIVNVPPCPPCPPGGPPSPPPGGAPPCGPGAGCFWAACCKDPASNIYCVPAAIGPGPNYDVATLAVGQLVQLGDRECQVTSGPYYDPGTAYAAALNTCQTCTLPLPPTGVPILSVSPATVTTATPPTAPAVSAGPPAVPPVWATGVTGPPAFELRSDGSWSAYFTRDNLPPQLAALVNPKAAEAGEVWAPEENDFEGSDTEPSLPIADLLSIGF